MYILKLLIVAWRHFLSNMRNKAGHLTFLSFSRKQRLSSQVCYQEASAWSDIFIDPTHVHSPRN
jgi:hypothetical protein